MISVITCWRRPIPESIQERNTAKTIGVDHEYIMVEQRNGLSQLTIRAFPKPVVIYCFCSRRSFLHENELGMYTEKVFR